MSDAQPVGSFGSEVPQAEIEALLARGRVSGQLSSDDLVEALKDVELTPELINSVVGRVTSEGIAYQDIDVEDRAAAQDVLVEDHITPPEGVAVVTPLHSIPEAKPKKPRAPRAPRNDAVPYDDGRGGAGDPVRMYLKEIGKFPLITGEEEVRLAQRIEAGIAAAEEIARLEETQGSPLPAEIGRPLKRTVADGQIAKTQLTNANLRLVVSIAKRYRKGAMHFLDLIQEGNIGLMRAVDKFDYRRGYKFSTYATWWVRQAISRAIADQGRTIRVPVHMFESWQKLVRTSRALVQEYGREPTPDELAEKTGIPPDKVRTVLRIAKEPVSLETPMGADGEASLGDFVPDDHSISPDEAFAKSRFGEQTRQLLKTLTPREERILRMRFGIDEPGDMTLEEVGQTFHLTRERIRQIETKALRKLRLPSQHRKLRSYLSG